MIRSMLACDRCGVEIRDEPARLILAVGRDIASWPGNGRPELDLCGGCVIGLNVWLIEPGAGTLPAEEDGADTETENPTSEVQQPG